MKTFKALLDAYETLGYRCFAGNTSAFFANNPHVAAAYLEKDGEFPYEGGGIAPLEILFFEELCESLQPKSIFVIGNSFGWSTNALALINPQAQVVSIDPDADGNRLTMQAADQLGLENVVAVTGCSPTDTQTVVGEYLGGSADLIFIDANHTDYFLHRDFAGCLGIANNESVFVLHDVLLHGMTRSFGEILQRNGLYGTLLHRTPSGIGIACRREKQADIAAVVSIFGEPALDAAEAFFQTEAKPPPLPAIQRIRRKLGVGVRRIVEARLGEIPPDERVLTFLKRRLKRAA
jgi:predicted O-methyltransferase YrrM